MRIGEDLISRQAAIDAIADYLSKTTWTSAISHLNTAAMILARVPSAQPEQRWIPCSERLPEERQEILATTTDNAWGDVVIIRTYYRMMHKSVIAWMPLPDPYREDMRGVDHERID